jgi:dihydrodipicolinate synthase/N-acetylneuraminate lyase
VRVAVCQLNARDNRADNLRVARELLERAAAAGADAVLIGTALSAAADPAELLAGLTRVPRRAR